MVGIVNSGSKNILYWEIPKDEWTGQPVFILGGGPSIKNFNFSRIRGRGKVIAVNDAGIDPARAPWADVLFWADRRWYQWNWERLGNHYGKYKIARKEPPPTTTHDIKTVRFIPRRFSHWQNSVGGFCGGSSAINLAYLFGSRGPFFLLGFDMTPGNWHDNHQLPPVTGQHRNNFIPVLEMMAIELTKLGVSVFNCNPRSALRCFPFAPIEEILKMDNLALIEREKYLAVWDRPEYRKISPGMIEAERAWTVCGMQPGQSLIDFGSGPCRATKWFQDRGIHALAIDFAPNAREFPDVPFVEACLWELPPSVEPAHHGFCCDVMEHIPPTKVYDTLRDISARVMTGCYFRIATRPDVMGPRLIGKPLHVTVNTGEWWCRQVETHFPLVDVIEHTSRDIMLYARH